MLAKESEPEFDCLAENTEKYKTFSIPIKKEVKRTGKSSKDYNLLIAQDSWQTYYQTLLTILLKEFVNSNINVDLIIKNIKCMKLNTKIVSTSWNILS